MTNHPVILSEAKNLAPASTRLFAALRVTNWQFAGLMARR